MMLQIILVNVVVFIITLTTDIWKYKKLNPKKDNETEENEETK